jgi:integrase
MAVRRKKHFPAAVAEYVRLATREGFQVSTINSNRQLLYRYHQWLHHRFQIDIPRAGLKEFVGYRKCLLVRPIARGTATAALETVAGYYLLKAKDGDGPRWLKLYNQVRPLCRVGGKLSTRQSFKPYSQETLERILKAAQSCRRIKRWNEWEDCEDYEVIMTLLYTGGRAQTYNLRVDELDFEKGEIRTRVKGGMYATIPLHPALAAVLKHHLATRKYRSDFLFRGARDSSQYDGYCYNRRKAWNICKRVQRVAGLTESVHPHRFRKTLAVLGRQLGLDVAQVQAILGHQDVQTTINLYATPDPEELKRAFASINLTATAGGLAGFLEHGAGRSPASPAPPGTEHGWNLIVSGLQWLFGGGAPDSAQDMDYRLDPVPFNPWAKDPVTGAKG